MTKQRNWLSSLMKSKMTCFLALSVFTFSIVSGDTEDDQDSPNQMHKLQMELENLKSQIADLNLEIKFRNERIERQIADLKQLAETSDLCNALYFKDEQGNSALHIAVTQTNEATVKKLIEIGADLNAINNKLETPIILAATGNDTSHSIKVIKYLIENGANVTATGGEGQTFLHRLVDDEVKLTPAQFHDMAEFLISKNLSQLFNVPDNVSKYFNWRRYWNWFIRTTPFQLAVKNIEIENATLSLLQNNRVDFNAVDDDGGSVLFYAVAGKRSTRLVSDLIGLGANPKHLRRTNTYSLLHWSAMVGNVEQLKFFISLGLDINAEDAWQKTPLHRAIEDGWDDVLEKVRLLIENGADVNTKAYGGVSPLDEALKSTNLPDKDKILELLRKTINETDSSC